MRAAAIALLACAALPAPARAAFPETSVPVALESVQQDNGWASVSYATTDSHLVMEAWMRAPAGGLRKNYLSISFYKPDGTIIQPWGALVRPGYQGVYLDGEPVEGVDVHQDVREYPEDSGLQFVGVSIAFNWPGAITRYTGPFKVLFMQHGEVAEWGWTLRGAGVTVDGTDSGDRTFYYVSEEFDHAQLNAQVEARPVYAVQAQIGLEKTIEVHDSLQAMFGTNALISANDITIQRAGEEPRDCRTKGRSHACYFEDFSGPDSVGAGTYTLRMTRAGEGNPFGDIVLAGADARLPV